MKVTLCSAEHRLMWYIAEGVLDRLMQSAIIPPKYLDGRQTDVKEGYEVIDVIQKIRSSVIILFIGWNRLKLVNFPETV